MQLNVRPLANNWRIFVVSVRLIFSNNREPLYKQKHKLNLAFLERAVALPADSEEEMPVETFRIWVMWWQGEAGMPDVIRATYDSIRRAAACEVVLITKDNYTEWVTLPDYMTAKIDSGKIKLPQLSDIIRASLLYEYGGMWIDSTMLCIAKIPATVYHTDFFTIKDGNCKTAKYVPCGRWNGQLMATAKRHLELYRCVRHILYDYWRKYDYLMDYLLVDYSIAYTYDKKAKTRALIDSVKPSNPNTHDLLPMMNDAYDEATYAAMSKANIFFKLTYKKAYADLCGGKPTYYSVLISHNQPSAI